MHASCNSAVGRHVTAVGATGKKTRSHHEIEPTIADGIKQQRHLIRIVFIIASDHADNVKPFVARDLEAAPDRSPNPGDSAQADDACPGGAGDVGGASVDPSSTTRISFSGPQAPLGFFDLEFLISLTRTNSIRH